MEDKKELGNSEKEYNYNNNYVEEDDDKGHPDKKYSSKGKKQPYAKKKVSRLYKILGGNKKVWDEKIDYKNIDLLRNFITEAGKIAPRRTTGVSPLYHRKVVREIKKARAIALLPFRVRE